MMILFFLLALGCAGEVAVTVSTRCGLTMELG